jgi:PAS domain S-box-containing protein
MNQLMYYRYILLAIFATFSLPACADVFAVFRNPDGSTKWQYVANFSSSILILTLMLVLVFLFRAHRRAVKSNRALTEIKATLEERVIRRTAVLQQTTEQLKEREAYIAGIVNSMPVMLIGLNHSLQITQWNHKAETITGRPFVDVHGKELWDAYPAITLTRDQVNSVLSSGELLSLKHTQRGQYTFDITLYPLDTQQGKGIVILISDVTKQINAENKLAERDKVSAMGELASTMAYDISLPIKTILSRVTTAKQEIAAADLGEVKEFLLQEVDTVGRSAHQATAIAQYLLDLARSHKDTKQLADVTVIMDQSIALAKELFINIDGVSFKEINVVRHYANDLPLIPCFPAELEQVFVRLMRNAFYAVSYFDKDAAIKPTIKVDIGQFFDSLWVKIEHNGQLLKPAEQLDIFLPFFSITEHASSLPAEQRLSYAYFIITEHHRGQMAATSSQEISSQESETCFNIQLPLV